MLNPNLYMASKLSKIHTPGSGEADGTRFDLCITAQDGSNLTIEVDRESLGYLITNLTHLAFLAAHARTGGIPVDVKVGADKLNLNETDVTAVGIAMSPKNSMHLVLRFFDFDLSYRVSTERLHSIAKSLGEAATALDAPDHIAN